MLACGPLYAHDAVVRVQAQLGSANVSDSLVDYNQDGAIGLPDMTYARQLPTSRYPHVVTCAPKNVAECRARLLVAGDGAAAIPWDPGLDTNGDGVLSQLDCLTP